MNYFTLVVIKASNSVCIILVGRPKSFQNKTWRKKHPNIRQAKELQNLPTKYINILQKKENFEFFIVRIKVIQSAYSRKNIKFMLLRQRRENY